MEAKQWAQNTGSREDKGHGWATIEPENCCEGSAALSCRLPAPMLRPFLYMNISHPKNKWHFQGNSSGCLPQNTVWYDTQKEKCWCAFIGTWSLSLVLAALVGQGTVQAGLKVTCLHIPSVPSPSPDLAVTAPPAPDLPLPSCFRSEDIKLPLMFCSPLLLHHLNFP